MGFTKLVGFRNLVFWKSIIVFRISGGMFDFVEVDNALIDGCSSVRGGFVFVACSYVGTSGL